MYSFLKRIVDILGGVVAIALFSPLFLIVTLLLKKEGLGAPVFFKQIRMGKNGKKFKIYKFRSMVVNSEEILKKDKELYEKYIKNNYKLEQHEDPRITKSGSFLRKSSLDEIPQFINVLKGEMSLVGPRPVVEQEIEEYAGKKEEFLSVKPGITGYWAVSGRSDVQYPERVELELYYVKNKSLWFDIKILFKTVKQVIFSKGAY